MGPGYQEQLKAPLTRKNHFPFTGCLWDFISERRRGFEGHVPENHMGNCKGLGRSATGRSGCAEQDQPLVPSPGQQDWAWLCPCSEQSRSLYPDTWGRCQHPRGSASTQRGAAPEHQRQPKTHLSPLGRQQGREGCWHPAPGPQRLDSTQWKKAVSRFSSPRMPGGNEHRAAVVHRAEQRCL